MPLRRKTSGEIYHSLREAPDTPVIVDAAGEAFARSYPDVKLQRLVVVIAAFNEAANIGAVLDEVPDQIADVPVSLLVIDDGSTDCTSQAARRHGALVCTLSVNRGHGVALRLGYRIAREAGAGLIATLDGDGQWNPADLPNMVRMIEEDRADFVVGSRQLGQTENTDRFRNVGVRFFAWLISRLTGARLTDTSSGLRVMRADLTRAVRQTQPQYQTSELLIGALFQGFRVAEVPTTMRQRLSGESKKGGNVLYGLSYARVIGKTWRRERKAARRAPATPAGRDRSSGDAPPSPACDPASVAGHVAEAPPATDAGPPQERGAGGRWLVLAGVTVVYAGIAVAAYLPTLPLDGSHTQICLCGDTAQQVWFLGWLRFALFHGHSLFYTNWILYPAGVNLGNNTAMTLLGILAAPVTVLAGPIAAYNLVLRAGFILSALAMFVVVRRLVRWWPAAFAAGLLYGFSPFMVGQGLHHEFLVFAPIPPLVFGILIDVFGRRRMPAWGAGVLLGLLGGAQFLIAAETFAMTVLFAVLGSVLALCYRHGRACAGHAVKAAAWALGTCAIIVAYPLLAILAGPQHIVGPPHPLKQLYSWHGDLLGAVLPSPLMRFVPASLVHTGASLVHGNLQENGTYLGAPLVLIAACLAVAYRRRPVTAVSGVLAVVSYALSLGTQVSIQNHATRLPGPFAALAHVPFIQDIEPARFSLFTALFVAMVLGTGLDALARPRRPAVAAPPPAGAAARWGWPALAAVLGVAALFPLVPRWPYPPGPAVTPPFFTAPAVERLPPGTVIVTLPFSARDWNEGLVWQAQASMRFRLVGGSPFFVPGPGRTSVHSGSLRLRPHGIDRVFEDALDPAPATAGTPPLQKHLVAAIRHDLRRYHIGAVIIDPVVEVGPWANPKYGMPLPARLAAVPGLGLAVRYVTAATGHPPQSVGGVLAWFHL